MFLIYAHTTHIYLHPMYKKPPIKLSTASSPAHQVMQITEDPGIESSAYQ